MNQLNVTSQEPGNENHPESCAGELNHEIEELNISCEDSTTDISSQPPCQLKDGYNEKCIFCDKYQNVRKRKKHQLTPGKRKTLFVTAKSLSDQVSKRLSSILSPDQVINDPGFYHENCLKQYERINKKEISTLEMPSKSALGASDIELQEILFTEGNTDRNLISDESNSGETDVGNNFESNPTDRGKLTINYIKSLETRILRGDAFELSEITNTLNEQLPPEQRIDNRFVKTYLINYYEENICFIYPKQKNKSLIVISSRITKDELMRNVKASSHVKRCAKELREVLRDYSFGLENKYCDAHNLRSSLENNKIPELFIEFFSELFNISHERLKSFNMSTSEENFDLRALKIHSCFQMMSYIFSNGQKRTPLHIMMAWSVYHTTRSKSLITILNRVGISISYPEIERYRIDLANYTARSGELLTPLPSHWNPKEFTKAALDNFDFEGNSVSGFFGTHHTVSVIFQNKTETVHCKPNLSEQDHSSRSFIKSLRCQTKREFPRMPKEINVPQGFCVASKDPMITSSSFERDIRYGSLSWFISRLDLSEIPDSLPITKNNDKTGLSWSAYHSIILADDRPSQRTGFLPVLPFPVTEQDTVYTALCNFKEILEQLDQKYLPVFCDEGVYKIVRHIKFVRGDEMEFILPMLGGFHMSKVGFSCIGKYLKDSGIENAFIENHIFGVHITDQALSGSHYSRSVTAYQILREALARLQLKAFFTQEKLQKYEDELSIIENIQDTILEGNLEESKILFEIFQRRAIELRKDFQSFVRSRSQESPLFHFWNNALIQTDLVFDLIEADRSGNWPLHVSTVKKLQPLFQAMDRVNYSRWAPIYLEDILNLEKDMPEVHEKFMKGEFVVKHGNAAFSSVNPDQALEQTINKKGKSRNAGTIGFTNDKKAVAVWDMIYHESQDIHNLFCTYTNLQDENEFKTHHENNDSTSGSLENSVSRIVAFIDERVNPFQSGNQPLRNIVTAELVHPDIVERLLSVFEIGCDMYNQFRSERIIDKDTALSATIHHSKLPSFKDTPTKTDSIKQIVKKKNGISSARIFDIARERNYDIDSLLCFDLEPGNLLFEDSGLMKKQTSKSDLAHELEKALCAAEYNMSHSPMTIIVDVMLILRIIKWRELVCFKDLVTAFCEIVNKNQYYGRVDRIDFVCDDYFEKSLKSSERVRRSNTESIELFEIKDNTPLPAQESKFYSSNKNKIKLQQFLRHHIRIHGPRIWPGTELIFSTLAGEDSMTSMPSLRGDSPLESLNDHEVEEADVKMMLHIAHCSTEGNKKIYLLSSDTDVLVLALNYWTTFSAKGLEVPNSFLFKLTMRPAVIARRVVLRELCEL
ncbi:hypothetical protein QAD02_003201 [Eretmocerus hayati]|uniref:Uncharacterized protein n=1 Tax=Eretmocerus hayati TaxID=131215 RepID=A0ACC2NLF6_9HYME|nr:hypothetical protein QAD02_003201 [Eretmocerus hayati]